MKNHIEFKLKTPPFFHPSPVSACNTQTCNHRNRFLKQSVLLRETKGSHWFPLHASSGSEVNLTRAANRAQSDGKSNACDSTEGNSLEVSEAKEQTAVKHDHGSFSSLRTLLDSTHFRHDAYQDEEDVSSTWPSLSLPKFHTHNVDNEEPLPYPGEPVGNETEGQTIDIPAESDHDSSRKPFIVSQSGDDYFGNDSESQYALTECSQSRRSSTVTYPSLYLESS